MDVRDSTSVVLEEATRMLNECDLPGTMRMAGLRRTSVCCLISSRALPLITVGSRRLIPRSAVRSIVASVSETPA